MFRWGILLALLVLALDQATKFMIVAFVDQSYAGNLDIREITPFFNIWHVRNSGIAFSTLTAGTCEWPGKASRRNLRLLSYCYIWSETAIERSARMNCRINYGPAASSPKPP